MIYYLLLIILPFISCCQSVAQKQYTRKVQSPNVLLFSALTSLIALCFFLITSGFDLSFDARLIPYSLGFAICYSAAWVGTVFAVRCGPLALSTLIISCSLIFPTAYGVLLGESLTPAIIIGVVCLLAAIVLVNLKTGSQKGFSAKWFVCVAVAFLGNGVCSILQNMHKRALGDSYAHEFMIIALCAAFLLLLVSAVISSKGIVKDLASCLPYSAANGVANALANFLMIILIGNIPNTVLYPSVSALNMILAFLLSFIVYRERFTKLQYAGYALGVISIVLLNI